MSLDSLDKLFLEELKDIFNAEKQLVQALPRMARSAGSPDLQAAFTKHHKETQGQVRRLEQVFREVGQAPRGKQCKGMAGLVEEGKEIMSEDGEEAVIDAALIAAAQRVEHYEIAAYGCLVTYAQLLGLRKAAELLQQNLAEEEATDKALTQLAEQGINQAAVAAGAEADEEEE
jgi:ferritin-like metal-binding protein YciE